MQRELFAAPDSSSGKMCREVSAATADATLLSWLERWLGASSVYRPVDGEVPVLLSARPGSSSGACWMRSFSDWPKDASVCSLSSILENGKIDRRYYLSPKACSGILRRAEKRGKVLPAPLQHALEAAAGQTGATAGTPR